MMILFYVTALIACLIVDKKLSQLLKMLREHKASLEKSLAGDQVAMTNFIDNLVETEMLWQAERSGALLRGGGTPNLVTRYQVWIDGARARVRVPVSPEVQAGVV